MLTYPNFNPVALEIGPIKIFWYGIIYLIAFSLIWGLLLIRIKAATRRGIALILSVSELENFIFYCAMGTIIGGRLGHVVFYGWQDFMQDWLMPFKVWQGGMSFHGGLLGVIVAMIIFGKVYHKPFWGLADFVAPFVPLGLGLGRIGNFINGELWGRVTTVPWAMVFPNVDLSPRHPSQLYEFLLEGILLFLTLWLYSSKPRLRGLVSAMFLLGYGLLRFLVEFFREPDPPWGYIGHYFSMGQLLSLPMIFIGLGMIWWIYFINRSK